MHDSTLHPIVLNDPMAERMREYFAAVAAEMAKGTKFKLNRRRANGKLTLAAQVQSALLQKGYRDELKLFQHYLDVEDKPTMRRKMPSRCRDDRVTKAGEALFEAVIKPLRAAAGRAGKILRAPTPRRRRPRGEPATPNNNVLAGPWPRR